MYWLLAQDGSVSALTTVYWICLIVGGGLLIVSVVASGDTDGDLGGDIDADADFDLDADVDSGHASATDLASWFSIRFVVYFAAMFGVIGVSLTHLTSVGQSWIVAWSILGGVAVGQSVHQLMKSLNKNSGDSTPSQEDYVNKLARVTIAITPPKKGEIALQVGRSQRYVPAMAKQSDMSFKVGDMVAVVDYRNGIGEVISQEEYEFLNNHS